MDGQELLLRQALQSTTQLRDCVQQTFEDLLIAPLPLSSVSRDAKQTRARESMMLLLRINLTNIGKALTSDHCFLGMRRHLMIAFDLVRLRTACQIWRDLTARPLHWATVGC